MTSFYTGIIFLAVFAMLIMISLVTVNDILDIHKKRQFVFIFIVVMLSAISEWLGVLLNGKSYNIHILHAFFRAFEHSCIPFIAFLMLYILEFRSKAKLLIVPLVIHALLEFLSIFNGLIFYIDSSNIYHHGKFYWIYIAIYCFAGIFVIIEFIRYSKNYQSKSRFILYSILLYFIAGTGLHLYNSNIRVDYICVTIDLLLTYIFYTDILLKTDSLTQLLNRRSYDIKLSNIKSEVAILYFDIDNFKNINDTYGHSFGDFCISTIGNLIYFAFSKNGKCYRIGGDEFCVIIDKKLENIENLISDFYKLLDFKQQKDNRIPNISIGYAIFTPGETDIESTVHQADNNMYKFKQAKKFAR